MKNKISIILILALTAGLLLSLSACGDRTLPEEEVSALVSGAILSDNATVYLAGECSGEGHRILGSRFDGNRLKIYALTTFGNYGFRNDMFIKVSGSGVIPAVLTFEKKDAGYELQKIEYPSDGSEYVKSIKRMFPRKHRAAALRGDREYDELSAQERSYAEAYLQSIGRGAKIGEYRDLNVVLLTDLGVSVEVSNALNEDKRLGKYPYWIGTSETLEEGKRMVRSLSLDEAAGRIIYETAEKESGVIKESILFDAATGEEIKGEQEK